MKKKVINWIILIVILLAVLFAVKWAEAKREVWLKKQDTEQKP
ncbi:hypothetical protein ACE01N_17640 [Saccharicrinis sp. FJH2]